MKLALALVLLAPLYGQDADAKLTIAGDITNPLTLTKADLAKLPRTSVSVKNEGSDEQTTYEGVLLYDVLKEAGAPVGKQLMGKALATYILAEARDGYQVVFALPEIDPEFMGAQVVIADKRNGGPLDGPQKPLQVIAPQDELHARSMYSLTKIEVVRLRP